MVTVVSTTRGRGGWFKTQFKRRQSRPFRAPLPYLAYGCTLSGVYGQQNTVGEFSSPALGLIQGHEADNFSENLRARAQAYDKVVGHLKGSASAMLAVNVAERKQSFDMIANRAIQLTTGARQLLRGNLSGMLRTFGYALSPTYNGRAWVRPGKGRSHSVPQHQVSRDEFLLRRKAKTAGSLWLEYWFGWKPLISDVHAAVDVLQDVNLQLYNTFTGSGSATRKTRVNTPWFYAGKWWADSTSVDASYGCKYRVTASINSPNALKANQLGLINPAVVAWELIPFSFLVDWFLPVGRFLESYTDTVGFTISSVQLTTKRTAVWTYFMTSPWETRNENHTAFQSSRSILGSLPIPGLMDRSGNGIASLTRAATAVSLLTGFFKTSKWS